MTPLKIVIIIITPASCILIERSFDGGTFPTKNKNKNNDTIKKSNNIDKLYTHRKLSISLSF